MFEIEERLTDGEQMTASRGEELGSGGIKEKGLMDMDNNVVIARGREI